MRIEFLSLLLLLASCTGKPPNNHFPLSAKVDALIDSSNFNGVVLIRQDTNTLYAKITGYANLEDSTLLTANNQFVIGSISKQITAVLLLQAYEEGLLQLEDNVGQYLPELEAAWAKQVNIHHLLSHTHGIAAVDQPLQFEPGSRFQYSQLGYHLLARILEEIRGEPFKQISTRLFAKHALHTTFHPDHEAIGQLVNGYETNEQGKWEVSPYSLHNSAAAGSFISNAEDLSKWNNLLHSGKLLKPATLALMKTRFATREHQVFGTVEYGYGLLFAKGEADTQIGALGYAPGFVSASYFYPKTGISLVVLENTARHLWELDKTFEVHTRLMEILHSYSD